MKLDVTAALAHLQQRGLTSFNWETRGRVEAELKAHLGRAPNQDEFKRVLRAHLGDGSLSDVVFRAEPRPAPAVGQTAMLAIRAGTTQLDRKLAAFHEMDE